MPEIHLPTKAGQDEIKSTINTVNTNVTSVKTDVTTVKTDVATANANINTINSRTSTMQSTLNTVNSNVSTMFNRGSVKSVQRGNTHQGQQNSIVVNISPVNLSKSWLSVNNGRGILSASSITLSNAYNDFVAWQVIEFY